MADLAILILRLVVGIIVIPHGAHKFQGLDEVNKKWREDFGSPFFRS